MNNINEDIVKAIKLMGYNELTSVQQEVIPLVLENKDVIVKSKTGSGKTASFVIPICQNIDWEENKVQALVLSPTRELALQIKEDAFNIGRFKRIKCTTLIGKEPMSRQVKELKQKMHIVVGTPGRVLDHIEKETIDLSNIKYLVIDEADEMLAMGFIDQVEQIIQSIHTKHCTVLLSATMNQRVKDIASEYMNDATIIEIEQKKVNYDHIHQLFYKVNQDNKLHLLSDLTKIHNPDRCIIFCNTQIEVDEVEYYLEDKGYPSNKLHGGMEQEDRTYVMKEFRKGTFRYLVATDVAARGIDVDDISLVVNYDVPDKAQTYVHRIGRTGRMNKTGTAITFVPSKGAKALNDIESHIASKIEYSEVPSLDDVNKCIKEFNAKISRVDLIEQKGAVLNDGILKIHINAGKKTKMRPVDIVGTLCSIDGVSADDIGIITVQDISTYVEVRNNKGNKVLKELQNKPVKGRIRKVSIANVYN